MTRTQHVALRIYDLNGRRVKTLLDAVLDHGQRQAVWNGLDDGGSPVAAGIYLYKLETEEFTAAKKMVMLK